MSGKRGAGEQITRENFREFEDEDEDGPSQPTRASADIMAKRKVLKPRGRLGKIGGAAATTTSSSGFSFGSLPASTAEPSSNPFSGFGKPAETTATTTTPTFSFGQPKQDTTQEPSKPNAFAFLATKSEPPKDTSKAQAVLSFVNKADTPSTSLVSTKNTEKASKIKALNDNFYTKITQEKQANPVSNFTPILRKYIDYYDQIDRDIDIPDADEEAPKQEEQKALPAPSFSFGQSKPEDPKATESSKEDDDSAAIVVDSASDSDSDDDIKVEGPTFTLAKPPTTTDSVFKLSSDATTVKSSGTGPTFTFAGASSKGFDSPFKLSKPAEKKEEEKKEEPKQDTPKAAFGSTNNFTWSPGQPISFADKQKDDEKPTAKFNFAATPSKENGTTSAVPAFSFGAKPAESTEEKKTEEKKPVSFNFGAAAKPAFSFGATPVEPAQEKKEEEKKPAFSFGATPVEPAQEKPAFSFGSSSTSGFTFGASTDSSKPAEKPAEKPTFNFGGASAAKPTFNFGGASAAPSMGSSSFNFSFSSTKPAESTSTNSNGNDDAAPEEETDVNFKPVTELKNKVEEKTGEEEEEATFTHRAKVMLFVPENKENPYASKGLGELKVLKHKETGKYRILVRADGSNRPILNIAVSKQFTYTGMGKGLVKIPTVEADGKLATYMIKVKTDADARNLLKSLTEAQK